MSLVRFCLQDAKYDIMLRVLDPLHKNYNMKLTLRNTSDIVKVRNHLNKTFATAWGFRQDNLLSCYLLNSVTDSVLRKTRALDKAMKMALFSARVFSRIHIGDIDIGSETTSNYYIFNDFEKIMSVLILSTEVTIVSVANWVAETLLVRQKFYSKEYCFRLLDL